MLVYYPDQVFLCTSSSWSQQIVKMTIINAICLEIFDNSAANSWPLDLYKIQLGMANECTVIYESLLLSVVFTRYPKTICYAEIKSNNWTNIWLTWVGYWTWWAPGWAPDASQSRPASSSASSASQQQTFCPAEPNLKCFPTTSFFRLSEIVFLLQTQFLLYFKKKKNVILSPGRFLFCTGSAKWTGLKPWCRRSLFTSSHSICSCCHPETEPNSGMKLWQTSPREGICALPETACKSTDKQKSHSWALKRHWSCCPYPCLSKLKVFDHGRQ